MKMEKKNVKAIIYARQSSGSDDFSESVENQINNCKALAESEGLEVIGIFSDLNTSGKTYPAGAEAVADNDLAFNRWFKQQTGNKKFRAGLGEAFKHLEEVSFIIVDDMTRLYRPFRGSYLENYINNRLTDNEVTVLQVKGGAVDLSKFDQNLISMLRNAINDEQIANQKKKSMQQLRKRRDSGIPSNGAGKAFGTSYDGKKLIIKDEFVDCIKFIFNEIEKFTPYFQILKVLNSEYKHLVPNCFYYSNIYHIVNNPVYCGYMYNSEGALIQNRLLEKPVISFVQWKKVNDLMQSKKGNPAKAKKNWLPFSGLLFCDCGSKLVSGVDHGKVYYYCLKAQMKHDHKCRIYADDVIKAVKPLLVMAYFKSMEEAKARQNATEEQERLVAELANVKTKQDSVMKMFVDGLVDEESAKKTLEGLKKKAVELNAELLSIKAVDNQDETTKHLMNVEKKLFAGEWLDSISNSDYEQLMKKVINKIIVKTDRIAVDSVYGVIEIPRFSDSHLPEAELVINGKDVLRAVVSYQTGKGSMILTNDFISVRTA